MACWEICAEQTAYGDYWLCAEVRTTYYTRLNRMPVEQRFSLYWTGSEWVDHAQYDRRQRLGAEQVEDPQYRDRAVARLRQYVATLYEDEP